PGRVVATGEREPARVRGSGLAWPVLRSVDRLERKAGRGLLGLLGLDGLGKVVHLQIRYLRKTRMPISKRRTLMADVLLELEEGMAILTVDRPAVRNAIGLATMDALDQALDAASDADVLVIRGGGDRAFISGGDLKELAKIRTESEAVAMALRMR